MVSQIILLHVVARAGAYQRLSVAFLSVSRVEQITHIDVRVRIQRDIRLFRISPLLEKSEIELVTFGRIRRFRRSALILRLRLAIGS